MFKRITRTFALLLILALSFSFAAMAKGPFVDVPSDEWFAGAVIEVRDKGLMAGNDLGYFMPYEPLTRAELVIILWRLAGKPVVNYAMPFVDVPEDEWYTEAVRWAAASKIVPGAQGAAFGPSAGVTREAAMTLLWRYAAYCGKDVSLGEKTDISGFKDANKINKNALSAMKWAVAKGIMKGTTSTTLSPADVLNRAQAATVLTRLG